MPHAYISKDLKNCEYVWLLTAGIKKHDMQVLTKCWVTIINVSILLHDIQSMVSIDRQAAIPKCSKFVDDSMPSSSCHHHQVW